MKEGKLSGLGKGGEEGFTDGKGGVEWGSCFFQHLHLEVSLRLSFLLPPDGVYGSRLEEGKGVGGEGQKKKFESDFLSSFHIFLSFFLLFLLNR